MKNLLILILLGISSSSIAANRFWIAGSASNWNNTANWSTSSGGAGGASVPIAGDAAIFDANGLGNCDVDVAVGIDGITINGYTGIIDLNGFTFDASVSGASNCTFSSGTISDTPGTSSLAHTSSGTTRFSGTTFNVPINVASNQVDFDGGTFNNPVVIDNTTGGSPNGAGGCTFNSTFQATNSGTGYFLMAQSSPDIFNGEVTLINTSTSRIRIAYQAAGTQFNSNILVSNTGGGIWFGENGGSSTLAAGQTISLAGTFDANDLRFEEFTQAGGTPQSLSLSGTARLLFDTGCNFSGNIDMDAPRVYVAGTTFDGTVDLEKTGASGDTSPGGNTFNSTFTMRNSGSGTFLMGSGSPDIFNDDVSMLNTGTQDMHLAYNSVGNAITGNLTSTISGGGANDTYISTISGSTLSITGDVTMTHSGSGTGVQMLGDNGDVTVGGNVIMNNSCSGTNCNSYIGESGTVSIAGTLTFVNDLTATTGNCYIANNSASSVSIGGATSITNSGSSTTSRFYLGNQGDVTFDGALTIVNSSSATNSEVYLQHGATSANSYNDNIILEVTNASCDGILFGNSTGTGTLAATNTITIGAGGYIAGNLYIRNFTQVGATAQALTTTGTTYFRSFDSNWGGDVDFRSPRMRTDGTNYSGTARLEKTGGIANDASAGGNNFSGDTELHNSGSNYFLMGNGSPDVFGGDLLMNNTGSHDMYLAYNSAGNTVAGDLSIIQAGSGAGADIYTADLVGSTLAITGDVTIDMTGSSDNLTARLGGNGAVTVGGDLTFDQNGTGTTSQGYIATSSSSSVIITGNTTITNAGSGTTKRLYGGSNGDITFGGNLTITNSSSATNSECYFNNSATSSNQYNGNIIMEVTNASSDGIRFGQSGGNGTLAAGLTVTVGAGGFIAGECRFRNFTQVGATAQAITCTGTTRMLNEDSNWGGNVEFRSPRMYTDGTSYNGTTILEKTGGIGDDSSPGGNSFSGNTELINSGTEYFLMGNGDPDTFGGDVLMTNTSTDNLYIAHNSVGNTIAGDLTVVHSGTGTTSQFFSAENTGSTLAITGNVDITMNGSADNLTARLGGNGAVTVGGNVNFDQSGTGTTANAYISSGANGSVSITGTTIISNNGSGTTKRFYGGSSGDVTFDGDLTITNNASATNSECYFNDQAASSNSYNGNIVLEVTDAACDGIRFGQSNGSGTLAATLTVSVGGAGFVAGDCRFRNFTQVGPTAQTIICTGTARVFNQDSDWGGDVDFRAPRMYTDGTTYNGTAYLEKTGGVGDDNSPGGNSFAGDVILTNSGSGNQFLMGNGSPDTFGGNLDLNNTGQDHLYVAHNSAGNTVAGDITIDHSASGTNSVIELANNASSTLVVTGDITASVTSSSAATTLYICGSGSVTVGGNVDVDFDASGASGNFRAPNAGTLSVSGDFDLDLTNAGTTRNFYLGNSGDLSIGSSLTVNNASTSTSSNIYLANTAASEVDVSGNTVYTNSGSGTTTRIYPGNQGTCTYTGTVDFFNSSPSTNSGIYSNHGATAFSAFSDDIRVNCTDAACDGVFFGNSGGSATLAATRTVSIEASGFISGDLYFRNFTQTGATDHTLLCTGTARIFNYDSDWGGNVDFRAPRMYTRGTTYNGTALLEKTGDVGDDNSPGGNTFVGDATLNNSGTSNQFLMGNGSPDIFQSNVVMNNTGEDHMYLAYNSAGNTIAGNLTVNHATSGASSSIISVSNQTTSTLSISGNAIYNISSSAADYRYYFGSNGDITLDGDLTITDNGTGTQSYGYVANGTNSTITIGGSTTVDNIGSGTTHRIYVGNNGDIAFTGPLTLNNSSTATNEYMYLAQGGNSETIMNGTVTVTNTGSNTNSRTYLGNSGVTTFNATLDITNSASAGNSQVYLNHAGTAVGNYNDDITVEVTNAACDGILFGNGNGTGTLADGQTITIGAAGHIAGYLYFRNFTQVGGTAQNLSPTGTARIENYDSEWNGNVDFRAPRHFTRGTTYNGTAFLQKNGTSNDASTGGNTFNDDVTFENTGTSYFMPANGTGNDFNANATYIKSSTGLVYPTYNSISTYAGNITVESTTQVTFGAAGNGRVQMDGTTAQSINIIGGTPAPRFRDLQTSNSVDEITLNTPIEVITELDLDAGNIISDAANCIYVLDNGTVSSVSDAAFVDGPCEKIGNEAFTFPVGKDGLYRYCGISAPSSGSASFRAEYFPIDPAAVPYDDTSLDPSIAYLSDCEYWIIDRNVSANNVNVTLSFEGGSPGCSGVDPGGLGDLVIARWDGAIWQDHGNGGTTGTSADGDIITAGVVTTFSPFTLGTITPINPLPVELINFEVTKIKEDALLEWTTKSELNNKEFLVQRSVNGISFETIGALNGAGNSSEEIHYSFTDTDPFNGVNYYRLKQVDFDGVFEYSTTKSLVFDFNSEFSVYPNPLLEDNILIISKSTEDTFDKIELLDASGRLVNTKTSFSSEQSIEMDFGQLASGVYMIRIQAGNKVITKKIVKS